MMDRKIFLIDPFIRMEGKMKLKRYVYLFFMAVLFALLCTTAFSQNPSGALRGQVTDPSGAAISGAAVIMTPARGAPIVVQSNAQGTFEFKTLTPGTYTLTVSAQGFNLYENDKVVIADQPLRLNVAMAIAVEQEKVQVSDTAPTVDVNPSNNAGAIVISGKELEALPDDPDELQSDLQALAGPSAGPNGGQMYIDGFTAGQLPPKSSIREIRVNQNPFSSEYDKLGYGRIEIFTKPGTDNLHGQFMADGNDSPFNAPNPFAGTEPPYYSLQLNGNVGGPITKSSSFFFNVDHRTVDELSVINATNPLSPSSTDLSTLSGTIPNPRHRTNIGPRIDWAINKNNTLTVRYQYYRDTQVGETTNQLSLPSQAYSPESTEHTVQISDTQVLGTKIVNETRFQYNRDNERQTPVDTNPGVSVLGAFLAGGNSEGSLNNVSNNYEFQNYTSLITGNHTIKFGGRVRLNHEDDFTTSAFNGTFVFSTFDDFKTSLPSQLTITQGSPTAAVTYYDVEPYVQDDWRVRPNITLSMGIRFEAQNAIHDHGDWAPRLGFAWGVGGRSGPPKVVIRGGSGIFYDRFKIDQLLQAQHLNGINQTQYIFTDPTCYPGSLDQPIAGPISSCGTPTSTTSTVYRLDPGLRAPYTWQTAISVERQVTKAATLSVTYLNSRGFDQLLTINASAPYPGTPCYPNCPIPAQNIYQYVSEANFKQNQLIVNSNVRVGSKLQLFGYYTYGHANSDTAGVSTFPTNSYDISADYGRGSFDIRNRLFLGGSIALPYLFRLSPFMIVSSGSPFNITSPFDLNGDSQYNNRPTLVSTATCPAGAAPVGMIYCTQYGTFDASGATGTPLPINYETGPNRFVMNLRLTKTFGFGPSTKKAASGQDGGPGGGGGHRGGGGPRGPLFGGGGPMSLSSNSDRRYNLTMGISFRNAFNNLNLANPNGVLGSPLFGVANNIQGFPYSPGTTANRRIDLVATFNF